MRRGFLLAAGFSLLAVITACAGAVWWADSWWTRPGPLEKPISFVVAKGGVQAIGAQMAGAGIIGRPLLFAIAAKTGGEANQFKAGEYAFPARITPLGVADLLASGHTIVHRLVIPEGWTSAEAAAIVASAPALTGQVAHVPAEGEILPETYFYTFGDDRQSLMDRMARAMSRVLAQLWPARAPGLPLKTPAEAIILASIVEKETAIPAERPKIAGVFYNRLRRGMMLQSDPTVTYALTAGRVPLNRPLTHADLATPSPYNTYSTAGLPPGPIANPGKATLQAVLHPEATDAFYFVADGSGGHSFAATIRQQDQNINRWRRFEVQAQGKPMETAAAPPAPKKAKASAHRTKPLRHRKRHAADE